MSNFDVLGFLWKELLLLVIPAVVAGILLGVRRLSPEYRHRTTVRTDETYRFIFPSIRLGNAQASLFAFTSGFLLAAICFSWSYYPSTGSFDPPSFPVSAEPAPWQVAVGFTLVALTSVLLTSLCTDWTFGPTFTGVSLAAGATTAFNFGTAEKALNPQDGIGLFLSIVGGSIVLCLLNNLWALALKAIAWHKAPAQ